MTFPFVPTLLPFLDQLSKCENPRHRAIHVEETVDCPLALCDP